MDEKEHDTNLTGKTLYAGLADSFLERFGVSHSTAAYAPGRIEILGNHTDYNEGYVLSAAINMGTFFLAAPSPDRTCHLLAGDIGEVVTFDIDAPKPSSDTVWANFIKGVVAKLAEHGQMKKGFYGALNSEIPLGAGLSSSAALEISAGMALTRLYGLTVDKMDLARIGQAAEHEYVGAKCGLMDQLSSLFGNNHALIFTDFRSLEVGNIPVGNDACFLMCNTRVKHSLVESEYNTRRAQCEEAARVFSSKLDHEVSALRDVTWKDWERHSPAMDPEVARRAAHVIGENTRVLDGKALLERNDLAGFGGLMFDSHESSIMNFENSCPELDFLVREAKRIPGVMGARLSGGGFGGSIVVLVHPRDAQVAAAALQAAYTKEYGTSCDTCIITPSGGARVLDVRTLDPGISE